MSKICIITGANGQLSQYLIKYLQENEPHLTIVGTLRHKSYDKQDYIYDRSKVKFELMDLSDPHSIENLILKYKPAYFFNLAANAYVGESWSLPIQQMELNFLGVIHQLEAIRKHSSHTRYFNMGTSEEFACVENNGPQNESTLISPRSPYGCAKAAARYIIDIFRHSYSLYAIQGWTFNFESKLRGSKYLTRKVTENVARIYHSIVNSEKFEPLRVGNMYSYRSWQHAGDVALGIWKQINQEKYRPELSEEIKNLVFEDHITQDLSKLIKPYVLSAVDTYSVKDFIERAFKEAGFLGYWIGEGLDEKYYLTDLIIDRKTNYKWSCNREYIIGVEINAEFFRPLDVTFLHGDATKAREELGWKPQISFNEIVKEMVQWDIQNYKKPA